MRGVYVPLDKSVLVELYVERGMSIPEVAAALDTNLRVVHRRMIEHGIPRRNPGTRPAHGQELERPANVLTPQFLVEAYQRKQMTIGQIAGQTRFSTETVKYYLCRAAIPVRRIRYDIDPKQLARLRRRGLSPPQIAAEFGCSADTIERALRRYGIPDPNQPALIDRIDPKQLAKTRKEGLTMAEIARRLNCSERTVGRAFYRYGIGR
jgi:DNA-binding CsgD family transcriptional regulator/transposase-like protein